MEEFSYNVENGCFTLAIGLAIEQFAFVEDAMFNLGLQVRGEMSSAAYAEKFYKDTTFRTKQEMVEQALRESIHWDAVGPAWKVASGVLSGVALSRNKIAHWRKIVFSDARPGQRCALVPLFASNRLGKYDETLPPKGSLHVAEIDALRGHYMRAQGHVLSIYAQIIGRDDDYAPMLRASIKRRSLAELKTSLAVFCGD